jgi:hypothetical protein
VLKQPKIWIKEDEDVYRTPGESGKDQKTLKGRRRTRLGSMA